MLDSLNLLLFLLFYLLLVEALSELLNLAPLVVADVRRQVLHVSTPALSLGHEVVHFLPLAVRVRVRLRFSPAFRRCRVTF